jgi:4-amino-4-deoxy-L-arabinose transferase-like glycosyltransferase
VPTGVSNDELDYILNAKSVFLQQSDISNTWNPFSLTTPKSSFPQAEIAPLIMAFLIGILPLSLFFSKLSYALISIGTIIIIYLIAKRLFDQKVAVIAGLIASVNPWLIFFGRTAYDTPLAIFFYLFALYVLLIARKWYILVAFPLFLLGFYSYIGTKLILIPFVAITSYYSWRFINNKKYTKQYLILITLCLMLLFSYIIQTFTSGKNRVSEISNPFMPSITTTVDYQRKQSLDTPFNGIFSNKFTVFTDYSIEKYINTFSPNFLFLSGDAKPQFSLWEHGVFYLIDGFFIIIGLYFLFKKHQKEAVLFSSLLLLAPLPSLISNVGTSYAIRSMLMAPLLLILVGMGIKYIIVTVKPKTFKTLTGCLIIIFYLFQIFNFLNIYLLRNPIYNSESFNFSSRELAKYLTLTH